MDAFDSFGDVLDFAIDREIEANQFYADLAKKMKRPAMREVFEGFAKEELGHKAKLETLKRGRKVQVGRPVSDLRMADYIVDVEATADMTYEDALVLAMKKEKAAFRLYLDLAAQVESKDQKTLFLALAEEEARHKLRFEIEYDEFVLTED
jgi:rubrerythrin